MNEITPFRLMTAVIRARRKKVLYRAETMRLARTALRTVLILALFYGLFQIWFSFRVVDGNGMFPALSDGDLTLCVRQDEYVKNDVVFYTVDGMQYAGRVAAKGGDYLEISEEGVLTVNGTVQTGEILYPTYPPANWAGGVQVPEGTVFVLGDYRVQTMDSRDFGCIPLSDVEAKLIVVVRHRGI